MEKEGIQYTIFVLLSILSISYFIYWSIDITIDYNKLIDQINNLTDKNRDLSLYCTLDALQYARNSTGAIGLAYVGGDYICVYTKDRDLQDVLNTCGHEWAHTHEKLVDP